VLAVGDQSFTLKCLDKFAEFRRRNKTIMLVTHSLDLVEKFCDQALWLDKGRNHGEGEPRRVVAQYLIDVGKGEEQMLAREEAERVAQAETDAPVEAERPADPAGNADGPADMFKATEGRWGTREIEITHVAIVGEDDQAGHVFQSGEAVRVVLTVRAHEPADDFVFGFGLFNADGVCCYGTNTHIEKLDPEGMSGEAEVTFHIDRLDLVEGTYRLDVAVHKVDGYPYDYHRQLYSFRVKSRTPDVGIYRPPHRWAFRGDIRWKPDRS
jgi:hypothetical protein